jgi:eukaryotic-like serine/threonine-protein kinase
MRFDAGPVDACPGAQSGAGFGSRSDNQQGRRSVGEGDRRAADPYEGRVIAGRFRLEAQLGRGAMGVVYRARHVLIERQVAIKLLRIDCGAAEQYRAWFLREARAVNRVDHPNIADIYDFGQTEDGLSYLVMELLSGDRLVDLLAGGPLPVPLAVAVVEQAAAALARAHDLGVIHRDLKPEHIFLEERGGRRGVVKLIDFGLAAIHREAPLAARGAVLGTPAYISPEQARGEDATPQSDLYSLGVVLFEMLTGRLPFESSSSAELLECHKQLRPPDPRAYRPALDEELTALVLRLLAKSPHDRHADAYHLLDDLVGLRRRLELSTASDLVATAPLPLAGAAAPQLGTVAAAALRASVLGRMLAAAYPGGSGPDRAEQTTAAIWRMVAELSRVEGELQVLARWDDNLRARAREYAAQIGHEVEDVSRAQSYLRRDIDGAMKSLADLDGKVRSAYAEWQRVRDVVDQTECALDAEQLHAALEDAGAAAAHHEVYLASITKVRDKIQRWEHQLEQAESQHQRLQEQLERHAALIESELAAGTLRFDSLTRCREAHLNSIAESEGSLFEHYRRRPECGPLFQELEALGLGPIEGRS